MRRYSGQHQGTPITRERLEQMIIDRARAYNWPDQADYVEERRACPPGWGTEVGANVALFMNSPPGGGLCYPGSREAYSRSRQDDWEHGKAIAELRGWIAQLNMLNRQTPENEQ